MKKDISKDDLDRYVEERRSREIEFDIGYDEGYENFKIGVILRQLREHSGLTQEEIATKLKTKRSAISRIENHAEDIRFSTLKSYAEALNKRIKIMII